MKLFESNMLHKKKIMLTSKKRIQYLILIVLLLQISNSFAQFDPNPLFFDEFKSTQLDKSKWGPDKELFRGSGAVQEVQCYTMLPQNVILDGENLQLIARKETSPYNCGGKAMKDYTSGSIRTISTINYMGYGKYEASIKLPIGYGYFTAFWTLGLGGGWPSNGEVDIMESVGQITRGKLEDFVRATCHWSDIKNQPTSGPKKESAILDMSVYHTYGVERTPQSIKWFVDGKQFAELDILIPPGDTNHPKKELHDNHSILFNFALGGWPPKPDATTQFPATMYVDWVRYYKYNAALSVPENDVNKMKVYTKGNMCNVMLPKTLVDLELTFYSMTGQKIMTKSYFNTNECSIDISSLSKGNYILQVTSSSSENYSGLFINQ